MNIYRMIEDVAWKADEICHSIIEWAMKKQNSSEWKAIESEFEKMRGQANG